MNKANNLFKEILFMLDTWCEDDFNADFTSLAISRWTDYGAYPRMVSVSNKSIIIVWSDEYRHKYLRQSARKNNS